MNSAIDHLVNNSRKIIYLTLSSTSEGDAVHSHVHEIVDGLKKLGWEVDVVEPTRNGNRNFFIRIADFYRLQKIAESKMKNVSALYIRGHFATVFVSWIAKRRGIPVVFEINGPYEDIFIAWPITRLIKCIIIAMVKSQMKLASILVVVTKELKEWAINEIGQKSIYVITNGVNVKKFHPEAKTDFNTNNPYVIFFGSLSKWQGIDMMLEAATLDSWPQGVDLLIVGDGAERKSVTNASLKQINVRYIGVAPQEKIAELVANSVAGLCPKNDKGNRQSTGLAPLKMFETMACGVPIIVTDFPGQADIVRIAQSGIIIPPGDSTALSKAVAHLFFNKEEAKSMGYNGRKYVEHNCSWDKRAAETSQAILMANSLPSAYLHN